MKLLNESKLCEDFASVRKEGRKEGRSSGRILASSLFVSNKTGAAKRSLQFHSEKPQQF